MWFRSLLEPEQPKEKSERYTNHKRGEDWEIKAEIFPFADDGTEQVTHNDIAWKLDIGWCRGCVGRLDAVEAVIQMEGLECHLLAVRPAGSAHEVLAGTEGQLCRGSSRGRGRDPHVP